MPRQRSTRTRERQSQTTQTSEDKNATTKPVTSDGVKPTADELKTPPFELGFNFPHNTGKTPWDYIYHHGATGELLSPSDNGMSTRPVSGWKRTDLSDGINAKVDMIPPLQTWKDGFWLSDLVAAFEKDKGILKKHWHDDFLKALPEEWGVGLKLPYQMENLPATEAYRTWCVTGEGCPGAWSVVAYTVPQEVATETKPHHPVMWPKRLKERAGASHVTWGGFSGTPSVPSTPKIPEAPKPPPLPLGLRFRCPGCGHWFKEADLGSHAKTVCPGNPDTSHDWAIMCDERCGCRTLDDVSKCKEGFPRPKPEPIVAPVAETEQEEVVA